MKIDVDKIARMIAERLREKGTDDRIPFDTGTLRRSMQSERVGEGEYEVGSNLSYALSVHDGRRAITIRPKKTNKKKRLFFIGPNGHLISKKEVNQPARKGRPWLKEAAEEMMREGFGFLEREIIGELGDALTKEVISAIEAELKF